MTRIVPDAGPSGLGAVLVQLQGDSWRVIAYTSRNLTDVERRYSQTEKEVVSSSSKLTINLSNVSTERHRSRQPVSKDRCYSYRDTTIK